ncbi:MAG: DUF885 domain-containing protein [Stackebrandtia sp.]
MNVEFVSRAERIVDALLEASPLTATMAGDHRFDGKLTDYSPAAVAERVSMLREASHVLTEVDVDSLGAEEVVDLEVLSNSVAARLFDLTETRDHEWDPLTHSPSMLINTLLLRAATPPGDRLRALAGRLTAVPDALATARAQLSDVPATHAKAGVAQFLGTARLILEQTPQLLAAEPGLVDEVAPPARDAATACMEFAQWLSALPEGRSPRLGRKLWEAKLWHALDTPVSASDWLDRAWRRLDEVGAELAEAAAELLGETASEETTARALARLAADRPDNDSVVSAAGEAVAEVKRFVAEHELVTLVDDPLEVVPMPEFSRGAALAYCDPPRAFEPAAAPTSFVISPAPAGWSDAEVTAFYSEYNSHMLRNLTAQEVMPGRYVQLANARRRSGGTRVRAVAPSVTFMEGWAAYAAELTASRGYGGLPVRIQQLTAQLRVIAQAIVDQLVHCDDMTESAATELMTRRALQSERETSRTWRRALLWSTQLSTYFVGYSEVAEIAAACPYGEPDRRWHDSMLAHGSVPPRHLPTLIWESEPPDAA